MEQGFAGKSVLMASWLPANCGKHGLPCGGIHGCKTENPPRSTILQKQAEERTVFG